MKTALRCLALLSLMFTAYLGGFGCELIANVDRSQIGDGGCPPGLVGNPSSGECVDPADSGSPGNDAGSSSDTGAGSDADSDGAACTFTDGIKNCTETDVDCGGSANAPKCTSNKACSQPSDCASGVCTANKCAGILAQSGYVKASNTDVGDGFGASVTLSADGKTLVVGAPFESSNSAANQADNSATASGAVYVFTLTGSTWTQQAFLKASNITAGAQFGQAVSVSADGNTLAVGASYGSNVSFLHGYAYIFTRTGTTWTEQKVLSASNAADEDRFGESIALSADGKYVVVGAPRANTSAGAAYVYTGASWTQESILTASNAGTNDMFGSAVAINGDGKTIAIGAPSEASNATGVGGNGADNSANGAGAAYVFFRDTTTWAQQAYIKASNTEAFDSFGVSVALSANGNTLAVGAPFEASNAKGVGGSQADNSATSAGAAYTYSRTGTAWAVQSYLKASNTLGDQEFGSGVAISSDGTKLFVGAPPEASNATGIGGNQADTSVYGAGAVYSFSSSGATWAPGDYIKASNTRDAAYFGRAIAADATGASFVVGSTGESSNAKGVNGVQANTSAPGSGASYVFLK